MELETKNSSALACPVDTLVTLSVQDAFDALKQAMQNDPECAWGWHCNIAMSHYDVMSDAGYTDHDARHKTANNGAARFMKLCFDIDTSKHKNFTAM